MKDRFKFRVWNEESKSMYDCQQLTPWALDPAQDKLEGVFIPFKEGYEIMQCTGLKDKNNKLIYEGDIMEMGDYKNVIRWGEIIGEGYGFIWESVRKFTIGRYDILESMTGFIDEYKIIGNIYENPELLKNND